MTMMTIDSASYYLYRNFELAHGTIDDHAMLDGRSLPGFMVLAGAPGI